MNVTGEFKGEEAMEKIRANARVGLNALALQLQGEVSLSIRDTNAVASSALLGSFEGSELVKETGVGFQLASPLEYAPYVEFGTKPHAISKAGMESLKAWVEMKLNVTAVGVEFSSGKARPTKKGSKYRFAGMKKDARAAEISRIAYAIAASIRKRGTKARHYMAKAIAKMGCPAEVVQGETGATYTIDPTPWLTQNADVFEGV